MHLEGPWLSTTGKKKGKRKFRNAEEARKARDLAEDWNNLLRKYEVKPSKKITNSVQPLSQSKPFYRGADQPRIPSLPFTAGVCTKPASKVYTGTAMKGIGTMHKSNAVPIFSEQEALDIAKMRR